jgi:Zn-dependent protease
MPQLSIVQQIAILFIPVLLGITIHEAAHAWVASKLGDTTAKKLGRLSFNPIKHIDLIGTIIVPILILISSGFSFIFGWAKPVPINSSQLKNPRRDTALITAAGPISNLLMAFLWTLIFKIVMLWDPKYSITALFLILVAKAGITINLLLAFLNLIPIPPLDGSRICASLLPPRQAYYYQKIEPLGFIILLALAFTGVLGWILSPLLNGSIIFLKFVFGL